MHKEQVNADEQHEQGYFDGTCNAEGGGDEAGQVTDTRMHKEQVDADEQHEQEDLHGDAEEDLDEAGQVTDTRIHKEQVDANEQKIRRAKTPLRSSSVSGLIVPEGRWIYIMYAFMSYV